MSDKALLRAFRLQCENAERGGFSAWGVMLMWRGQEGVEEDDLIDIAKAVTAEAQR